MSQGLLTLEELQKNDSWQLHVGLRHSDCGIITLPSYHSTAAYLKWKREFCPELGVHYVYVSSIHVSPQLRRQGLATRLLHILCTANDKSPQRYDIGLVASPAAGSELGIRELEAWYEKRGFVYDDSAQMHFRKFGDKNIHKVISKYASL
jgi:ribosomal protein S18 acetylase RimI-like enzyme